MTPKQRAEMGEAVSFLCEVFDEAGYTPAEVRRLAENIRETEVEAEEPSETDNKPE